LVSQIDRRAEVEGVFKKNSGSFACAIYIGIQFLIPPTRFDGPPPSGIIHTDIFRTKYDKNITLIFIVSYQFSQFFFVGCTK